MKARDYQLRIAENYSGMSRQLTRMSRQCIKIEKTSSIIFYHIKGPRARKLEDSTPFEPQNSRGTRRTTFQGRTHKFSVFWSLEEGFLKEIGLRIHLGAWIGAWISIWGFYLVSSSSLFSLLTMNIMNSIMDCGFCLVMSS